MKKIIISFFALIVISCVFSSPAQATDVNENITEDTTWTLANSPYYLTDTIFIYPSITLSIEPGVIVKGNDEKQLKVSGTLVARGEENNPITFTSSVEGGGWGGLVFLNSSTDAQVDSNYNYISGSVLEYTNINSSTWDCIYINGSSPLVSHSNISNCIFLIRVNSSYGNPIIIFSNTLIAQSGELAIWHPNGQTLLKVVNNNITSPSTSINSYSGPGVYLKGNIITGGINIEESTDTIIENNIIHGNLHASGIIQYNQITSQAGLATLFTNGNTVLRYNTISGNTDATIRTYCDSSCVIQYNNISNSKSGGYLLRNIGPNNITATNNYWGTTNSNQIKSKIYDYYDDPTLGVVSYIPYLRRFYFFTAIMPSEM